MFLQLRRWAAWAGLCIATLARAQDAGMALSTLVGYTSLKNTTPLTPEKKAEVDGLARSAQLASSSGQYGEALRHLYHGMAIMRGVEWTALTETAAGLQLKVDHALWEPGQTIQVRLHRLYAPERAPTETVTTKVLLRPMSDPVAGTGTPLGTPQPFTAGAQPWSIKVTAPDLPAGNYLLQVRLEPEGAVAAKPGTGNPLVKSVAVHIERLAGEVAGLREQLAKAHSTLRLSRNEKLLPLLPNAELALTLVERADASAVRWNSLNLKQELASARAIAAALEAGKNPYANQHGDMHRAYRSAVDNTIQPYRLFLPEQADLSKPLPLVVALHGMGGDENSFFDAYDNGAIKREAEKRGYAVLCPKGREPTSMYRGPAEQDVLDALAEVRRDYTIDAQRLFLMGHSMGGYGTWSIAMNHPELFAALGPISGGGNPAGMEKIKLIPQIVVHGDADETVAVEQSRRMVEAGKKAGTTIQYVEVPGGKHSNVVVPNFPAVFAFFDEHAKTAGPASTSR